MPRIDPALERISARLTTADLRADATATGLDELDLGDDLFVDGDRPFVDVYSVAGLERVFEVFGVRAALAARGLSDYSVRVTRDDAFTHRLELLLSDGAPIMDMRLSLRDGPPGLPVAGADPVTVVVVEWLLMQDPRAAFSASAPRLPGQAHPGTGLGRLVHNLLMLLCRRLGRDGLVTMPERFHLAALYPRIGFISIDPGHDSSDVLDVLAAAEAAQVPFPAVAWAVERGLVRDRNGGVYVYAPRAMACAVSARLERALATTAPPVTRTPLSIDKDALRQSLRDHPVEGLSPAF